MRLRAFGIMVPVLLAFGCATAPRVALDGPPPPGAPAWPAPPQEPRVSWLGSFDHHQDLFAEAGLWRRFEATVAGPRDSQLVRPSAVAADVDGAVAVADPGAKRVHLFDRARRRYVPIGEEAADGLPSPVGVTFLPDGSLAVADSRLGRVERFARSGKHLGPFAPSTPFRRPVGVALAPDSGEVFVVDVLAHAVLVFNSDGHLLRTFGTNGSQPGEFNFPTHLAVGTEDDLLVADSMNFRLQRLRRDGTPVSVIGKAGDAQGDFAHPKGVAALRSGVFAAVEGRFDTLLLLDGDGRLLLSVGGPGSGDGEFWLPAGLGFDASRNLLFVADSYNARVQVFRFQPECPGGTP